MLIKRVLAQIIDFVLGILTIFLVFTKGIPIISQIIANDFVVVFLAIGLMGSLYFLIQYPFMQNQQTIGKAFFHLQIISTDQYRKEVPVAVIFQREILCKLASCFFICLPLFFGKEGGHEASTHTKLISVMNAKEQRIWKKSDTI
ncbi:RDD family protein [Enterococcus casseliflavus]|jgi:RDD family.|uniref:RDD family protein n=1 Tax=Enterococcus TaxID=1350 RepID=UPI00041D5917|nr:RDD family protein [Enterococcus casseliflavus]MDB1691381.1 RDD family protein [Enterococcus casseliflavus]MEB6087635.1 RDD family protein [Enterococcus casseliflavus]MEB6148654.1 RDD family protein [Enterococcus casseliflavus]STP33215.1 RDD family [Enterococcus casseliflavus]